MEKERLEELLDSIYELEGLVHLAIAREDIPDVLPDLIARKSRELASRTTALVQSDDRVDDTAGETSSEIYVDERPVAEQSDEIEVDDSREETPVDERLTEKKAAVTGGRLVFSINDRYRFRRELFENSDADFNTTLALVASMESYEEAEDYFTVEREWDPAVPAVSDFLEIIRKYFG